VQLSQDLLIHPEQRVPLLPAPALIGQLGKSLALSSWIWLNGYGSSKRSRLAWLAAAMAGWTVEY
jgi:hypothetical protein